MINQYQKRKARAIVAALLLSAATADISIADLPHLAARMSHREWISVAFAAKQSVPDHKCKAFAVALLLEMA